MPTADNDRPQFRGCVFCYSAEWAVYGAKRVVGAAKTDD